MASNVEHEPLSGTRATDFFEGYCASRKAGYPSHNLPACADLRGEKSVVNMYCHSVKLASGLDAWWKEVILSFEMERKRPVMNMRRKASAPWIVSYSSFQTRWAIEWRAIPVRSHLCHGGGASCQNAKRDRRSGFTIGPITSSLDEMFRDCRNLEGHET